MAAHRAAREIPQHASQYTSIDQSCVGGWRACACDVARRGRVRARPAGCVYMCVVYTAQAGDSQRGVRTQCTHAGDSRVLASRYKPTGDFRIENLPWTSLRAFTTERQLTLCVCGIRGGDMWSHRHRHISDLLM